MWIIWKKFSLYAFDSDSQLQKKSKYDNQSKMQDLYLKKREMQQKIKARIIDSDLSDHC